MKRIALVILAALLLPATAHAAYVAPGASIVSASLQLREQGDDTSDQPDLSADGRYVVFHTTARNLFPADIADPPNAFYAGGVFRRDLVSGALELVALGDLRQEGLSEVLATGASTPSVSGDGRYVAFTTGAALVPQDTNGATDVYVRDMTKSRSDASAYELVSAKDGGDAAAAYAKPNPDRPLRDPGADTTTGTSISDDGRAVAFSVREMSTDLPDHATVDVPPGQILVRDRVTKRTTLVTTMLGSDPPRPIDGGTDLPAQVGALVLSADGTTIAWTGQFAFQQTRLLPSESIEPRSFYYLWRRVADGPTAPTRRITGPVDLDDPACDGTYTPSFSATGPCYGPLADSDSGITSISGSPPALSADGRRVALLAGASPRGISGGAVLDLFVTDMSPGVSRKAGTVELTREGVGRDPVDSSALSSVAMSEDGRWLAVLTQRTRFTLPALAQFGDARARLGVDDLYLVDLASRTIQRAIHSFTGGDPDLSIQPPVSLSANGGRIAFASAADNLFFGDANQRTDAFAVDRLDAPPPAPDEVEPPVDDPAPIQDPAVTRPAKLSVFVRRSAAGKIKLQVRAPAPGTLTVKVRGKPGDSDGVQRGAAKLLATLTKKLKKKGTVTVTVTLAKRYRSGLKRARTLDASATVRLAPKRGVALERSLSVRFKSR